jgi:hypothetical protein
MKLLATSSLGAFAAVALMSGGMPGSLFKKHTETRVCGRQEESDNETAG